MPGCRDTAVPIHPSIPPSSCWSYSVTGESFVINHYNQGQFFLFPSHVVSFLLLTPLGWDSMFTLTDGPENWVPQTIQIPHKNWDLKVISPVGPQHLLPPGACTGKSKFSIKSVFPWGLIVLLPTEFLWAASTNVNIINHKQGNWDLFKCRIYCSVKHAINVNIMHFRWLSDIKIILAGVGQLVNGQTNNHIFYTRKGINKRRVFGCVGVPLKKCRKSCGVRGTKATTVSLLIPLSATFRH